MGEHKFNVGDKVKVIRNNNYGLWGRRDEDVGVCNIGTVILEGDREPAVLVESDKWDNSWYFDRTELEFISDAKEPQSPTGSTADMVNQPPHYTDGGIETIDFIEAKKLNFNKGNSVKYISRSGKKGEPIQDLQKAIWYLNREIKRLQKEFNV